MLKYELLDKSHMNCLLPVWSDPKVIRYTNIKSPCTLEEVRERIDVLKKHDVFVVRSNEDVIGIIGCPCIDQDKKQYGLFYHFRRSSWGQGFATESTGWLLDFMRKKYHNIELFADVVVDNIASEKILRRFGFELASEETLERAGVSWKVHNYKLVIS